MQFRQPATATRPPASRALRRKIRDHRARRGGAGEGAPPRWRAPHPRSAATSSAPPPAAVLHRPSGPPAGPRGSSASRTHHRGNAAHADAQEQTACAKSTSAPVAAPSVRLPPARQRARPRPPGRAGARETQRPRTAAESCVTSSVPATAIASICDTLHPAPERQEARRAAAARPQRRGSREHHHQPRGRTPRRRAATAATAGPKGAPGQTASTRKPAATPGSMRSQISSATVTAGTAT